MRSIAAAWLVVAAGCIGGGAARPAGSACSTDGDCAASLVCQYGRCRAECAFDRDCGEGQSCVAASDSAGRVCTVADEGAVEGCPEGLVPGPGGLCRERCEPGGEPCSGPRQCSTEGIEPVCVQISLRVEMACGSQYEAGDAGWACSTSDPAPALAILDGLEAGRTYALTVRFRGAVETTTYVGGEADSSVDDFWRVGGQVEEGDATSWNAYGLAVDSPEESYFVNADVYGVFEVYPIDFEATVLADGGAGLLLFALASDGAMVRNPPRDGESLVVVDGVDPPADHGQFLQMDLLAAEPED